MKIWIPSSTKKLGPHNHSQQMQNNLILVLLRSSAVGKKTSVFWTSANTKLISQVFLLKLQIPVWSWGSSTALLSLRQASKWENLTINNNHNLQSRKLFQNRCILFCNFSSQPALTIIWLCKDCLVSETRALHQHAPWKRQVSSHISLFPICKCF